MHTCNESTSKDLGQTELVQSNDDSVSCALCPVELSRMGVREVSHRLYCVKRQSLVFTQTWAQSGACNSVTAPSCVFLYFKLQPAA